MAYDGLQVFLDASDTSQCSPTCVQNGVSNWLDGSGNAHHFENEGGVQWKSTTVAGQPLGFFDINTGHGFRRQTWAAWNAAESVTVEAWAKLDGYRSTNTGIVTNFNGGSGKHNWMWNSGGGFHMNGMKGSTNLCSGCYPMGEWVRYALVSRANHGYDFWVNNERKTTMGFSGGLSYSGNQWLGIGMREDVVEPANAEFSIVRIYNRALSDTELSLNFDAERQRFGY